MTKPILLNAFDMMTPVHQSPGLWRHPESRVDEFTQLSFWTDLAKTLEDGGFSSLFLADILGVYDVYGGNADVTNRGECSSLCSIPSSQSPPWPQPRRRSDSA